MVGAIDCTHAAHGWLSTFVEELDDLILPISTPGRVSMLASDADLDLALGASGDESLDIDLGPGEAGDRSNALHGHDCRS